MPVTDAARVIVRSMVNRCGLAAGGSRAGRLRSRPVAAGRAGADAPGKSELFPEVIATTTRYVCDRDKQCRALSELHAAIAARRRRPTFRRSSWAR